MSKKSLILYSSWTGNTEKVAARFKKVFEEKGWQCDMFKIDHHTDNSALPFKIKEYDFLCIGSPVIHKKPIEEMVTLLYGHQLPPNVGGFEATMSRVQAPPPDAKAEGLRDKHVDEKIILGPDTKKGVVFMTYGGIHLGPKEIEPAISLLSLLMEHIPFECIGRFYCPGKFGNHIGWYKDLKKRPNERDLRKAEIFMEEILEDLQ